MVGLVELDIVDKEEGDLAGDGKEGEEFIS